MRERRFSDKREAARREVVERGQAMEQSFKRRAELVLGRAGNGGVVELGFVPAPKAEMIPANVSVGNGRSESVS